MRAVPLRRCAPPPPRRGRRFLSLPRLGGGALVIRGRRGSSLFVLLALLLAFPTLAVEPSELLPDPALESRARDIGRALRCVVCQNQSIDDSNAEVARDMRRAVRERLSAGDDDQKVFAYMVARYGDYVLLKPPFKAGTWALWLGGPLVLLVAGGLLLLAARRRKPMPPPKPLDEAERHRLDLILRDAALRAAPQDEDFREKPHPEERPKDASRRVG